MLRQWRERFRMGGGGSRSGGGAGRGPISLPLIVGLLFFGWLLSGVYSVDEGENGVVTRFGDYAYTTTPGMHWHLPAPMEAARVINVTRQRTAQIGFSEDSADIPDESQMITGDRNIVQIQFIAYYNVSDVVAFAFNVRNPETAVRQVAESAMREVIGQRQLDLIMTTERNAVEQGVLDLIQRTLTEYDSGVQVVRVELRRPDAPQEVSQAFNDVLDARQDAETAVNNANRDTARILNDARAYREQVVRQATGEADRFIAVHSEYRQAPQVTRDRLYLETMERVYRNGNLMILDQRGGAVPYLPLDGMIRRNAPQASPPAQRGGR